MSKSQVFQTIIGSIPNLSLILTPLLSLPLVISSNDPSTITTESKCFYLIILMAVFWSLNPIPLPITSLLPIVLLPLLGLASTETACGAYLRANNILFFGCLTLALAIEKSNLHQRIALKVLCSVSAQFRWMLLGFMMTTMLFSMWIVSTATVAMMLPIADEIFKNIFASVNEIQKENDDWMMKDINKNNQKNDERDDWRHCDHHHLKRFESSIFSSIDFDRFQSMNNQRNQQTDRTLNHYKPEKIMKIKEIVIDNDDETIDVDNDEPIANQKEKEKIVKLFYLCIAYSATIGGVSTLTSNGPNLIMKDILENQYENQDPVDYTSWLMFATPVSILICVILWAIFSSIYFRNVSISRKRQIILREHIIRKYQSLGSVTFHEWAVLFVFFIMIMLYMLYKPQFISGWSIWFENDENRSMMTPKPASAAILCVIMLFLIPYRIKWNPNLKQEALLDWQTIQKKLEWSVLIIRGGGFALADAVESSGLSKVVGSNLSQLGIILPLPSLIAFISIVANIVIEFMRTSSTASILFPVAIKLSENIHINPLKIIIPCATSCAYAFISPVGTTSNTLIFYHGKMSIKDMIIPGLIAKMVSISMMMLNTFLLGDFFFGIEDPNPEWIIVQNFNHMDLILPPLGVFENITTTTTSMMITKNPSML